MGVGKRLPYALKLLVHVVQCGGPGGSTWPALGRQGQRKEFIFKLKMQQGWRGRWRQKGRIRGKFQEAPQEGKRLGGAEVPQVMCWGAELGSAWRRAESSDFGLVSTGAGGWVLSPPPWLPRSRALSPRGQASSPPPRACLSA